MHYPSAVAVFVTAREGEDMVITAREEARDVVVAPEAAAKYSFLRWIIDSMELNKKRPQQQSSSE